MTVVATMLGAYPVDLGRVDREALARCVEECLTCAHACTACADACLSELDEFLPALRTCVRSTQDCADICTTTARVLSRHTGYDANLTRAMLAACEVACRSCGDEGDRHASAYKHCRLCAAACRRCEQACRALTAALG